MNLNTMFMTTMFLLTAVDKVNTSGENIIKNILQPMTPIVIAISFGLVGLSFALPGKDKSKAKEQAGYICVGAVIILGAVEFAKFFIKQIAF